MGIDWLSRGVPSSQASTPKMPEPKKINPDEGKQYLVVVGIHNDVVNSRWKSYAEAEKHAEFLTEMNNEPYRIYALVAVVEPDMFVNVRHVANPLDEAGH